MLQLMLGLLDFGMGATITKEFSTSSPLVNSPRIKSLLKTLEITYLIGSLMVCLFFIISANWMVGSWLNIEPSQQNNMANVIAVMGISLGLQFPYALYSNGMLGLQRHREMNFFQILNNTLRYGFGVITLLWKPDLLWFFIAQIFVSFLMLALIRNRLWSIICIEHWRSIKIDFGILNEIKKFTFAMGLSSILAVLIASSDRLILSKMVSTYEFGAYAIAFTATGLLQLAIQPFYKVYFPRFSELSISANASVLRYEYFRGCELLAAFLIPLSLVGIFFPHEILFGWLGKDYPAESIEILQILLIGICCSGLGWLPAALQQSQGVTKLHINMMLTALLIGIPLTTYLVYVFGPVGAASIWITHGVIEISVGLWLMHKKFFNGYLLKWYKDVICPPLVMGACVMCLAKLYLPMHWGRYENFVLAIGLGCVASGLAIAYHYLPSRMNFFK